MLFALESVKKMPLADKYIKDHFFSIMGSIIRGIDEKEDALKVPRLFQKYGFKYQDYIDSAKGSDSILTLIHSIIHKNEEEYYSSYKDSIKSNDDVNLLIYDDLYDMKSELSNKLLSNVSFEYERTYTDEIISKQIELNFQEELEADLREKESTNQYKDDDVIGKNEDIKIEELFMGLI